MRPMIKSENNKKLTISFEMVQPLLNQKQLSSARGATRDLTSAFQRYKSGQLDSDESENTTIVDQKSR